jgi:hypothetical protein
MMLSTLQVVQFEVHQEISRERHPSIYPGMQIVVILAVVRFGGRYCHCPPRPPHVDKRVEPRGRMPIDLLVPIESIRPAAQRTAAEENTALP